MSGGWVRRQAMHRHSRGRTKSGPFCASGCHFIPPLAKSITSAKNWYATHTPIRRNQLGHCCKARSSSVCGWQAWTLPAPPAPRRLLRGETIYVPVTTSAGRRMSRLREPAGHRGHADLLLCLRTPELIIVPARTAGPTSRRAQGRARLERRVLPPATEVLRLRSKKT